MVLHVPACTSSQGMSGLAGQVSQQHLQKVLWNHQITEIAYVYTSIRSTQASARITQVEGLG